MLYLFSIWCAMAILVLSLAIYRKVVSDSQDDLVHLAEGEEKLIPQQVNVANKLSFIDKWGQTLTIVTVVFGLILGSIYLYSGWVESAQLQR
jgi:uncharacterized membrane protein